eukprot:TRINITY_DN14552_c0_g1_i1.p1 TRINITY_DN14552_c0_g1~~TRINITY_DN14552_c0_g1_i1.p1  ORF type:complete len:565 (-),score=53.81 TRINITY_DN14552_c0_g1_i1:208-1902(-)
MLTNWTKWLGVLVPAHLCLYLSLNLSTVRGHNVELVRKGHDRVLLTVGPQGSTLTNSTASAALPEENQLRIAVVGSGPSAQAAVVQLKKHYGKLARVEVFEAHREAGGVITSTPYGPAGSWNDGVVDSGLIVGTRFFYPNLFDFVDAEKIQTERRQLNFHVEQPPHMHSRQFRRFFAEFYSRLLQYPGSFQDYISSREYATNPVAKWFIEENEKMRKSSFQFMTLDLGTPTSHVAGCLAFLNMTGNGHYDAPRGGYGKIVKAALAYADKVHLQADVRKVKPAGPSGPVELTWHDLESHRDIMSTYDRVVLTVSPNQLRRILHLWEGPGKNLDLLPSAENEYDIYIAAHKNEELVAGRASNDVAFYEYMDSIPEEGRASRDVVNAFPNGRKPPYVTFFHTSCDQDCRRAYVPEKDLFTEYRHSNYQHGGSTERARTANFLRNMSSVGGLFYAGVWTADSRFAEGTWVSGMRAAMQITKENAASFPFSSSCSRRSFFRYALWFEQEHMDAALTSIPPSCFSRAGQVPSFFDSQEHYEAVHQELLRGDFEASNSTFPKPLLRRFSPV